MKIPITILILAVSATLGWRQWITLQQLHEEEHALASKAAVGAAGREVGGHRERSRSRESRADREAQAKTVTAEMIASLVEQAVQAPGEQYRKMEGRIEGILEQLYQMNSQQLRLVIAELRNHPQPDGNAWYRKFLSTAITALADTDPQAAMAILEEENRGKDDSSHYDGIIGNVIIGKWALIDPLAAITWMRENPSKVSSHEGRASFISGLATRDPRLAFQSLLEFQVYELHGDGEYEGQPNFSVTRQVARSARTLEERTAMLGILREIADRPGDDPDNIKGLIVSNALHAMAEGIGTYDYERVSAWLDSLNLRPDETAELMQGLRTHLSPEDLRLIAGQRIGKWVRDDPRAVENWLAQTPDGPAKREAESHYASSVAAQQPEPGQRPEPPPPSHPLATAVEGQPGLVISPFSGNLIDVSGLPSGTLVSDPGFSSGERKYFHVP